MNYLREHGPSTMAEIGKAVVIEQSNLYVPMKRLVHCNHILKITGKLEDGTPAVMFDSNRGSYLTHDEREKRKDRYIVSNKEIPVFKGIEFKCPYCNLSYQIDEPDKIKIIDCPCGMTLTFTPKGDI